jgi:hypothetical protein
MMIIDSLYLMQEGSKLCFKVLTLRGLPPIKRRNLRRGSRRRSRRMKMEMNRFWRRMSVLKSHLKT